MLRVLRKRENGIIDPLLFSRAETARRNENLELSKHISVQEAHLGSVNSVDLDVAEQRYLLSGSSDSVIVIHDTQGVCGDRNQTYPEVCRAMHSRRSHKRSVETVQWYPVDTGIFLSSGADHTLNVWDTNKLQVANSFVFDGLVYSHHMSPVATKHSLVALGTGRSTVRLVDLRSGSAIHQLKGHNASVYTVQWSSREEFQLASGSADNKVILWDVRKPRAGLMVLDQYGGKQSASKHSSRTSHDTWTAHDSISRDTRTAHDGIVNSLCFTSDGLHLVTYGTDNQVRLWDACSGELLQVNYGHLNNTVKKAVRMEVVGASSPPLLVVPSDSVLHVYRLFSGEMVDTLNGHYNLVHGCVWHPDTHYLFSGGADRNILVWTPVSESQHYHHSVMSSDESHHTTRTRVIGGAYNVTADAWSSDSEDDS